MGSDQTRRVPVSTVGVAVSLGLAGCNTLTDANRTAESPT